MGLTECLAISVPFFGAFGLAMFGPLAYSVYKVGVKATSSYVVGLPSRLAGYVFALYSSKFTTLFAVATALGGTINSARIAATQTGGWGNVATTFITEVYRETLSATGLIARGFQELTRFLTQEGVCSYLVSLDQIAYGLFWIWRGIAIIIVVLWLVSKYREWRNLPFDMDVKAMTIVMLFTATALVNIITSGETTTGLIELIQNMLEFLDSLSGAVSGNETLNQSFNSSLKSSTAS